MSYTRKVGKSIAKYLLGVFLTGTVIMGTRWYIDYRHNDDALEELNSGELRRGLEDGIGRNEVVLSQLSEANITKSSYLDCIAEEVRTKLKDRPRNAERIKESEIVQEIKRAKESCFLSLARPSSSANQVAKGSSGISVPSTQPVIAGRGDQYTYQGGKLEIEKVESSFYRNTKIIAGVYEKDGLSEFSVALLDNSTGAIKALTPFHNGDINVVHRYTSEPFAKKLSSGKTLAGFRDFDLRRGTGYSNMAFVVLNEDNISSPAIGVAVAQVNLDAEEENSGAYSCNFYEVTLSGYDMFINVCKQAGDEENYWYDIYGIDPNLSIFDLEEVYSSPRRTINFSSDSSITAYLDYFHASLQDLDIQALMKLYSGSLEYYETSGMDAIDAIQRDRDYRKSKDVALFLVMPQTVEADPLSGLITYQALSIVRSRKSNRINASLLNMSIIVKEGRITSINGKVDNSEEMKRLEF